MQKFNFSDLSLKDLKSIVSLKIKGIANYRWTEVENVPVVDDEKFHLRYLTTQLQNYPAHIMNEAMVWARAIYPLLRLAEQGDIFATSEVILSVQYSKFELNGIIDGILGRCIAGQLETPYFVVIEAKRGVESKNPQPQLYGQLLAAAHLNWEDNGKDIQEIFGCYTIADIWTFVRGTISEIDSDNPAAIFEHSREYNESTEIETILKILKSIVKIIFESHKLITDN